MENIVDNVPPWERVIPPLWWPAAKRYLVADRTLPNGVRQHMVKGHVEPGRTIANAQVIGEDNVIGALFSQTPSHLSRTE